MNHKKTRCRFEDFNRDFNDLYASLKKENYSDGEIRRVFHPLVATTRKSRRLYLLLVVIFLAVAFYSLTFWEAFTWHLSAVFRIALIKLLPYFDWRYLKNERCLVPKFAASHDPSDVTFNCYVCENIKRVDAYDSIDEDVLSQRYLDLDVPIILTKGIEHWIRNPDFLFAKLAAEVDFALSYPCNVATNVCARNVDVATLLKMTESFDSFFVHFRNCEGDAVRTFRKYSYRPDVFPDIYSPTTYNWMLWSKDYNATAFKKIELAEKVALLGQMHGKTRVKLSPRNNCEFACPVLDFVLNVGEYVIFTALWDLHYRPFETGYNVAALMETRSLLVMEEPAHPRLSYHFTADEIIEQGRTTREYVDTIKRWLAQQNDHRIPHVQDEMVVLFLLSCENDIDLTKNTIAMYFKCKKDGPEIFDDRDMSRAGLNKGMNTVHMSSIPTRTDENYVVHYFKLHDTSYSNFDLVPIMKLSYMLVDIAQEKNPPNGLVVVIDMKGFGLMHLTRLKMGAIKTYLQFLQEGFPLQLKAIHILNGVYFFDKIMAIVKVFMKSELIDMIKVHSPNIGQEELFRCIPQKCLPREYGGDLQSEKELHEKTVQQFCDKQEFWRIEELIRKS